LTIRRSTNPPVLDGYGRMGFPGVNRELLYGEMPRSLGKQSTLINLSQAPPAGVE